MSPIAARLQDALARVCSCDAPLGVAVSGGGDSLALLLALAEREVAGLQAVTVDHGLRPEAAGEASFVAGVCARLGVPHAILKWQGWDGCGNLQDAARRARRGLISDWARARGLGRVALGHTRDDQAETVLMRLGRGAGLDGLSGMAETHQSHGLLWLRPFLGIPREDLRAFLTGRGQRWIDDPSNDDPRFDRVRARAALGTLGTLGITAEGLAATAGRLAAARTALACFTLETAERTAQVDRGDVLIAQDALAGVPQEIARRLVVAALCWVASADYPPRAESLSDALTALKTAPRITLHGCLISREKTFLRIAREPAAVVATACRADGIWDGRWRLVGPERAGSELRALGESGLSACPDWREAGLPRASLLASPAVWSGETLVAAPLAGVGDGWRVELTTSLKDRILSH